MQTRRDRLQAYQYLVRRIMAALLGNEPESPEQPMRRVKNAMFSGIMVGALACGGVAFYGWITHMGDREWRERPGLVQLKETGAQYYWNGKVLHPITNYTSAKLILGEDADPTEISRLSLSDQEDPVPRGPEIGLQDVPPDLPPAEEVQNGRWTVCNHVTTIEENGSQQERRLVDVIVNLPVTGTPLNEDDALVVETGPSRDPYLIWNGTRLEVTDRALLSLGLDSTRVRVQPTWLNALPAGPTLEPRPIPDVGDLAPSVGENTAVVGEVFVDNVEQYYVMRSDGLVKTTETQALLLLGSANSPNNTGEPTRISVADASDAMSDQPPLAPEGHPSEVPELVNLKDGADTSACLQYDSASPGELRVSVGAHVPTPSEIQPIEGVETGQLADRVTVPGGTVSLIQATGNAGTDGTLYIVADTGKKYAIPNNDALNKLGYGDVDPMKLPAAFADMLRSGSALDPEKARTPVIGQANHENG